MPTKSGSATQGKKTHEDRASSKAMSARTQFRDTKPENRIGAKGVSSVSQAASIVAKLGRG